MLKIRLITNKSSRPFAYFESPDEKSAKYLARKKALVAMIGALPSITVIFQKYNDLIHEWVDFGEIKGCM